MQVRYFTLHGFLRAKIRIHFIGVAKPEDGYEQFALHWDPASVKMCCLVVSRRNSHYDNSERDTLVFEDFNNFCNIIMFKDNVKAAYNLHGPYDKYPPKTYPLPRGQIINAEDDKIYVQKEGENEAMSFLI